MIHKYEINGLPVQTGDLICTTDGATSVSGIVGYAWRLMGKLLSGEVDHIVIYIGPGGHCIEAGPLGVKTFMASRSWNTVGMLRVRGIVDTVYGVAYPLHAMEWIGPAFLPDAEKIREAVAEYSLAQVGKAYNFNFFNAATSKRFYCSQLAWAAYLDSGVDLDRTAGIVLPQRIWDECHHRRVG